MRKAVSERIPAETRPKHWAQPVALAGVRNLYRVADGLYRSGQPTISGMRALEALGVRTVINLRLIDPNAAKRTGSNLDYVRLPMVAWLPREADIANFLRIVTDADRRPVLVHCRVGADRTGMLAAAYRVMVQGWSRAEAIAEMTRGGFGFNPLWKTLVYRIERLDAHRLGEQLGMAGPARQGQLR